MDTTELRQLGKQICDALEPLGARQRFVSLVELGECPSMPKTSTFISGVQWLINNGIVEYNTTDRTLKLVKDSPTL
jgi:hypothetical protein